MELLYILWTDSCNLNTGWIDVDEVLDEPEYLIETIGFLIDENKEHVIICSSVGVTQESQVNNAMMIPKCSIKQISTLKRPSKGKK